MKVLFGLLLCCSCSSYGGAFPSLGGGSVDGGTVAPVIWPIGDSLTEGDLQSGGSYILSGGYRAELYRLFTAAGIYHSFVGSLDSGSLATLPNAKHDGHSGYETFPMLLPSGITTWGVGLWFNVVVILAGTNDVNHAYDPDTCTGNNCVPGNIRDPAYEIDRAPDRVVTLAQTAREMCHYTCGIVIVTLPPIAQKQAAVDVFNVKLRMLVANESYARLADAAAVMTIGDIGEDGIHPTAIGYVKLGDAIYATLASP